MRSLTRAASRLRRAGGGEIPFVADQFFQCRKHQEGLESAVSQSADSFAGTNPVFELPWAGVVPF